MKKLFLFIVILSLSATLCSVDLKERIQKYSGKNSSGLLDLLANAEEDTLSYLEFILNNSSASDLAVLSADYLMENLRFALKTKNLPYSSGYDENIFRHFVLPHRMSQEPLEHWRPAYYNELKPLVEDCTDIAEAAIIVNLWCLEEMTYKPTHGRDQSAFTSGKRGYGRCEEMMIIYMCAARAVGIPVRSCSAPYWNFTDSNHAWIEVWTPDGWKYLGEPASQLNKTWFTKTTERSTLITAKAFGNYQHPNAIKLKDSVTTISSIEFYTESYNCRIRVSSPSGDPVSGATVIPYAVSFGGLWPLTEMETDENGICEIPLGKGSTLFIAGKDYLTAWQMLNNTEGKDLYLELTLDGNRQIDEDFLFQFTIPGSVSHKNEEPVYLENTFDLKREIAALKHKERLNNQKFTAEFARFYDLINFQKEMTDEYFSSRNDFLEKADQLAANADDFLHILKKTDENGKWVISEMIRSWDIKDLCEIPDSTALENIVQIFSQNRYRFAATDSLFSEGCIARTWHSASPVQNGWQLEFYDKIKPFISDSVDGTVADIIWWIKEISEIEENFAWTYYSGTLNPLEILNMHYMPEFYRTKMINSALKLAGIPVRWEGQLEFHDGICWRKVNVSEPEEEENEIHNFTIRIFVDDKEVKAEPYENFLIAALDRDGYLYNTWFDGENDSLMFKGKYRINENEIIHLEAAVRNSNGDATVAVRPITNNYNDLVIKINTPHEYLDFSREWDPDVLDELIKISEEQGSEGKKIILVLAEENSEPQTHTLRFLGEKMKEYQEAEAYLYVYSEQRSLRDLKKNPAWDSAHLIEGKPILANELPQEDYPAIFIFSEENELIFSTYGYNMGIADLITKKLK